MYYIIKSNGKHSIKHVENTTDATYYELQKQGHNVCGQFGRRDYAEAWRDFRNGTITAKERDLKLGIYGN